MEDQLISFKTAKLAKEKGFDECVSRDYNEKGKLWKRYSSINFNNTQVNESNSVSAPTQSLLQKWLRDEYNCHIDIISHSDGDNPKDKWETKKDIFWSAEVNYYGKNFDIEYTETSDFEKHFNKTYEEALEIGLYEALKLIK